ncbi:MAG TPA: DUF58 domain-containing protein [Candidatus Angelobacter sp.]|jgi:uncharacterized protein (DUF58 family)|nr:DUF58 domain-containing protein [Candidatus Angelobacter sp.]
MQRPNTLKSFLAGIDGEAWLRFGLSVVGLALAFFAALLSTVTRESGNVAATTLFATTALLLAGAVGVTTVPYLTRRVVRGRLRSALDFEITREGIAYLGVALVIGVAALNTNNNLLFIVLAAMLAAIAVSGFASAAVLRGLELDIALPETAFAGRPIVARIRLVNARRWIPAFSVSVTVASNKRKKKLKWEWQKSEFTFPKRRTWLRLPDYTLRRKAPAAKPPEIFDRPVYFTYIPSHTTAEAQIELKFPRRGRYSQDEFILATRFPFSFLIKSRKINIDRELLVYPALLEADDFLDVLPMVTGEFTSNTRGRGSELYLIREHTPQDPVRFVDWKATAKTGALKVREFTREDERRLRIVFDNPGPGAVPVAAYERAVSVAASLAGHFTSQNVEVSYAAPGYGGGANLHDFWRYLALVQPAEPAGGESILNSLPVSEDYNIVITARQPGSISTALWASSYIIYMEP